MFVGRLRTTRSRKGEKDTDSARAVKSVAGQEEPKEELELGGWAGTAVLR